MQTCGTKDYNEWEYESKKCPKCKDGIIGESEGGDYANTHVHMLLETNSSVTYPELRHALGDINVGDYQEVYDKNLVCKYVTKHIDKDIDYELTFRHNIGHNQNP